MDEDILSSSSCVWQVKCQICLLTSQSIRKLGDQSPPRWFSKASIPLRMLGISPSCMVYSTGDGGWHHENTTEAFMSYVEFHHVDRQVGWCLSQSRYRTWLSAIHRRIRIRIIFDKSESVLILLWFDLNVSDICVVHIRIRMWDYCFLVMPTLQSEYAATYFRRHHLP
jgi:hypothetical protein